MQNPAVGTISVVVQDSSGAHIPGVTVIIRNSSNEMTWTTSTNETGALTLPGLPAGTYEAIAVLRGFGSGIVRGTRLGASETVQLKVVLVVGRSVPDVFVEATANPTGITTFCRIDNFPVMGVSSPICPDGRVSEVSSRTNEAPSIIESDPKYSPQSPLVSIFSFEYPPTARAGKVEGSLLFAVDIGKDGQIRFIETLSDTSASPYLKDFSVEHIRSWNFKPEERFITIQMIYKIAR
jgi:hypothetical protein